MQLLDDLPHLEILDLAATNLVVILSLTYFGRISVLSRSQVATADRAEPLEAEHAANVTFKLKDYLLDLVAHVSLLDALQLRH